MNDDKDFCIILSSDHLRAICTAISYARSYGFFEFLEKEINRGAMIENFACCEDFLREAEIACNVVKHKCRDQLNNIVEECFTEMKTKHCSIEEINKH